MNNAFNNMKSSLEDMLKITSEITNEAFNTVTNSSESLTILTKDVNEILDHFTLHNN